MSDEDGAVSESVASEGPRLRAEPYHCPYCGLDELRPAAEGWLCLSCARNFTVRLLAVRREEVLG